MDDKMEFENEIYFYNLKNDFSYMSNFYSVKFVDNNSIEYNCNEQYFMYHKCILFDSDNVKLLRLILEETSPLKVKRLGRKVKNFDERVWRENRYNIMLSGLRLKFGQNRDIQMKLLSTKPKILYEASKTDRIWGIGFMLKDAINKEKSEYGQNLLGKALMQVRDEI